MRAQVSFLPDRRRLHLQDGPIDLIIEAFGATAEKKSAYAAATCRFKTILDELCQELPLLRAQAGPNTPRPTRTTARRMSAAVAPYATRIFITPMAAVAGAVAEEILHAMTSAAQLSKAYVNDGGDIAVHLAPGAQFTIGMIDAPDRLVAPASDRPSRSCPALAMPPMSRVGTVAPAARRDGFATQLFPSLFGTATLRANDPVRGIATSGFGGRSFSLGIADAVTVLAKSAAMADAAATVIANAVDLPDHPAVRRTPARSLSPDTDLGDLLVTREVGSLSREEIDCALASGVAVAEQLRSERLIHSAALHLCGVTRVVTANDLIIMLPLKSASARSLIHA